VICQHPPSFHTTMEAPNTPFEQFEPTQLGMYTVIDDIAEGTFGKVKSASQPCFCYFG
jgi:hypothetical protein